MADGLSAGVGTEKKNRCQRKDTMRERRKKISFSIWIVFFSFPFLWWTNERALANDNEKWKLLLQHSKRERQHFPLNWQVLCHQTILPKLKEWTKKKTWRWIPHWNIAIRFCGCGAIVGPKPLQSNLTAEALNSGDRFIFAFSMHRRWEGSESIFSLGTSSQWKMINWKKCYVFFAFFPL